MVESPPKLNDVGFTVVDSLEHADLEEVVAGARNFGLLYSDDRIRIVDPQDDGFEVDVGSSPDAFAVGERLVFTLKDGTLEAWTAAGTVSWQTAAPDGGDINLAGTDGPLVILTTDGRVVGYEPEGFVERFSTSTRVNPDDGRLVAARGRILGFDSSQVDCLATDGTRVFTTSPQFEVRSASIVGETVVVTGTDGKVRGYNKSDGQSLWTEVVDDPPDLPPAGSEYVLYHVDDELRSLDVWGTERPLAECDARRGYATPDGRALCMLRPPDVDVFALSEPVEGEALSATIDTGSLTFDGEQPISVTVNNEYGSVVRRKVWLLGENIQWGDESNDSGTEDEPVSARQGVELLPGERKHIDFPPARATGPGDVEITVTVGDTVLDTETVSTDPTTGSRSTVSDESRTYAEAATTQQPTDISLGIAIEDEDTVRVTCEGDIRIERLRVGDVHVGDLAPGESRTVEPGTDSGDEWINVFFSTNASSVTTEAAGSAEEEPDVGASRGREERRADNGDRPGAGRQQASDDADPADGNRKEKDDESPAAESDPVLSAESIDVDAAGADSWEPSGGEDSSGSALGEVGRDNPSAHESLPSGYADDGQGDAGTLHLKRTGLVTPEGDSVGGSVASGKLFLERLVVRNKGSEPVSNVELKTPYSEEAGLQLGLVAPGEERVLDCPHAAFGPGQTISLPAWEQRDPRISTDVTAKSVDVRPLEPRIRPMVVEAGGTVRAVLRAEVPRREQFTVTELVVEAVGECGHDVLSSTEVGGVRYYFFDTPRSDVGAEFAGGLQTRVVLIHRNREIEFETLAPIRQRPDNEQPPLESLEWEEPSLVTGDLTQYRPPRNESP